jgi:hypothetical protein
MTKVGCGAFLAGFESRSAHGCEEQWNMKDTWVLIGSGLLVDKNPTSCVSVYYDCLGRDPLCLSFYRFKGGRFTWKIRSV